MQFRRQVVKMTLCGYKSQHKCMCSKTWVSYAFNCVLYQVGEVYLRGQKVLLFHTLGCNE